jgi:hypothetical protein
MSSIEVVQSGLAELGAQIAAEHEGAQNAAASALLHAKEAGLLLLRAKGMLPHGAWLPWLRDQCQIPERTAQAYMRIARRWEELEKSATVADLTFREADRLLSQPKGPAEADQGGESDSLAATRRACEAFAELRAEIYRQLGPCKAVLAKPDATVAELKAVVDITTECHLAAGEMKIRIERWIGEMLNRAKEDGTYHELMLHLLPRSKKKAKEREPGMGWANSTKRLLHEVESINKDFGGMEVLAKDWTPEVAKSEYDTLTSIQHAIQGWIEYLKGAVGGA